MKQVTTTSYFQAKAERSFSEVHEDLLGIYNLLYAAFGDRQWWPAQSRDEVIIGAILCQNVSWSNTEKAITRLEQAGLLSFGQLSKAPLEEIETHIVSTRYYRMKAKKLKAFAQFLHEQFDGQLDVLFDQPLEVLRRQLLGVYGIGPETADDILLYAAEKPSFIVDAYTKRIFHRLGFIQEGIPYEALRQWFMDHLPHEAALFNQYHAMLDGLGHHYCAPQKPVCPQCPLQSICPHSAGNHTTL